MATANNSQALGLRSQISGLINKYGSTVVLTPRTPTKGSCGGYEANSDGEGGIVTTIGVPSGYSHKIGFRKEGNLKEGESAILLKGTETVDKNYKVTWNSEDYDIAPEGIKRIPLQQDSDGNPTILAIRLTLSRRLD